MSTVIDLRVKPKQPPVGIAAGAEDAKYQAKYKELKRKVKDIEADNDKLHFKVLQAKLTIRRMKMERAILYDRLTSVPPSPTLQDRHPLPPMSVMQGGGPGGPPHPGLTHLRPLPGGGQPQHRDYPFHPGTNVDLDQQRVGGGPAPHIHPGHHQHHHHQHHSHARGDPRMNLTPGIDPRGASVDNQPAGSSPRLPIHSPPSRISSTHEGSIARHPQHAIPPTSAPYEARGASNIPHDNHHVHTSPPSSHHNAQAHSRKRSHSHSSPRTTHPHQIEVPQSGGLHTAQPFRVLSSGSNNNNNSGHGPGSGTVTPAGTLQQPLHQYPENLAPVQPPLNSPLSEIEFERGGRAHHPHAPLHQQLPHQHPHPHAHSGGGGHQHPHSQHSHHHHIVHHHHQHNHPHPAQAQAHAQNEYGGVGDPPTSASPAIQAHGTGYESTGGRGTVGSGPPVPPSSVALAGSTSGSGRTHAHPRERMAYEYSPPTQPEGKRERERDGVREHERDRDPDREWERERDRAREYSRGELINYSPPHHRTRSSQSRPLSRAHSQSHLASGGRSQSQTTKPNPSGEYEHSASNSSRSRTAPSSGVPAPQASGPEDHPQGYRDYPPPPDSNTMYAPRPAPSSRAPTPGVPSNTGSGSAVGHASVVGPDASINSGPRDREAAQRDRGKQQAAGPPPTPSPAAAAGGAGDNDASDHTHNHQPQSALDSGRKRSRNEMEVDGEYQGSSEAEGGGKGRRNGASGGGREVSLQPQDDSRGAKRYHRQADSSPERERR